MAGNLRRPPRERPDLQLCRVQLAARREPTAFDILAWNADNPRMPAKMHAFYLRRLYIDDARSEGELELAGTRLDLADITTDA
jgi:poly(3-hydroxyalkanoate) synthetase